MTWLAAGIAFVVSFGFLFVLRPVLSSLGVVDVPNERSSHDSPTLRGAGLAPLLGVVSAYVLALLFHPGGAAGGILWVVLGSAVVCGALGWAEDVVGLKVIVRAALQLLIGIASSTAIAVISGNSPWWIPLGALAVAGYINVANFMDGINGISGLHAVVVGVAFAVLGGAIHEAWLVVGGLVIAAAFAGFLPWNMIGGRVFLGDVGSYLLGGAVAVLAIGAVAVGAPLLAVLGPVAIYLSDTGVTLARRILAGERWYEAHRSHNYQRLTDVGLSHLGAALVAAGASAISAVLGLLSINAPAPTVSSLTIAILAVVALYFGLAAVLKRARLSRVARSTKEPTE